MIDGWRTKHADGFTPPVVAQWEATAGGGFPIRIVTLFADGLVLIEGDAPVELLPYVLAEWHDHQREKKAY